MTKGTACPDPYRRSGRLSRRWTTALLVVVLAATLAACTSTTADHPHLTSPTTTSSTTPTGLGRCPAGWVCGTCPDGLGWRYLNDPQVLNNPPFGLDPQHPCT
jgi:hypothetical protein